MAIFIRWKTKASRISDSSTLGPSILLACRVFELDSCPLMLGLLNLWLDRQEG
ncbi:C2H2-type domain-containing protein [Psidium guajava]|nr:C2H2-type domain-containing protein [Psidium guajava]